jgi:hypothetical protein
MNDRAKANGEGFRGSLGSDVPVNAGSALREGLLHKARRDLLDALSQVRHVTGSQPPDADLIDGSSDAWRRSRARVELALEEIASYPTQSLAVLKVKLRCYEELIMTFGEEDSRVTKMAVNLASEAARLFCSVSDTVDLAHHAAIGESDDRATTFWRVFARPEVLLGWGGRRSHD